MAARPTLLSRWAPAGLSRRTYLPEAASGCRACQARHLTQRRFNSAALSHPVPAQDHGQQPSTSSYLRYGQPLPSTHPHLLAPGELTPGIQADEYEQRRRRLIQHLEPGAVVVIASARLKYATGKIFYKFRQDSNFWYLTGWEEPDSALVLEKDTSQRGYRMTMFVRSRDAHDEVWNGPRSGKEGATEVFGADEAVDITLLPARLRSILDKRSGGDASVYVDVEGVQHGSRSRNRQPKLSLFDYLVPSGRALDDAEEVASILSGSGRRVKSASQEFEKLRLVKSAAEIKVLRKAADISADAHAKVMRFCEPTSTSGKTEASLVAHFEYQTALANSARPAYVPVCASGSSSLTIHYISNQLQLQDGDLVVLDAGCEWGGYASDITRTFPVSGRFSSAQRDLYEALLRVHRECIKLCTENEGYSMEQLHRRSVDLMRAELTKLGFDMRGGELERILYPHFLTHPLGIDLHDTPGFSRSRPIQSGMVITIEPGIFVPPLSQFPKAFHGLSVRVEDEVLVQRDTSVVLSVDAPKEVADVEACFLYDKNKYSDKKKRH
ncbi:aminopeptidase [Microbotryomycetes sp. JL201]|nr:aminopeptidase [Microbotryomycetes sp. JL201]